MRALIIALFMLSGCSSRFFIEGGIGDNSGNWNDCGNTGSYIGAGFTGALAERLDWEIGYEHHSQWRCGWPTNDEDGESFLNHWGAKVRYYP